MPFAWLLPGDTTVLGFLRARFDVAIRYIYVFPSYLWSLPTWKIMDAEILYKDHCPPIMSLTPKKGHQHCSSPLLSWAAKMPALQSLVLTAHLSAMIKCHRSTRLQKSSCVWKTRTWLYQTLTLSTVRPCQCESVGDGARFPSQEIFGLSNRITFMLIQQRQSISANWTWQLTKARNSYLRYTNQTNI